MGTIAQKLQAVASSKAAIASAITGKGGSVPTKFSDYGTAVSSLPNTYTAGDEGKVVSNGALVSQTSLTITENNTYDTTTKNSVTVNVSGSGGNRLNEYITHSLTELTVDDLSGVTSISTDMFGSQNRLIVATIPNTVTSLGARCFSPCSKLKSVTIGTGVSSIAAQSFSGCSKLQAIYFASTRTTIPTLANVSAFNVLPSSYYIFVPSSLLTSWKEASVWSNVASHISPYYDFDGTKTYVLNASANVIVEQNVQGNLTDSIINGWANQGVQGDGTEIIIVGTNVTGITADTSIIGPARFKLGFWVRSWEEVNSWTGYPWGHTYETIIWIDPPTPVA